MSGENNPSVKDVILAVRVRFKDGTETYMSLSVYELIKHIKSENDRFVLLGERVQTCYEEATRLRWEGKAVEHLTKEES